MPGILNGVHQEDRHAARAGLEVLKRRIPYHANGQHALRCQSIGKHVEFRIGDLLDAHAAGACPSQ